jgi:formylglycine-generating enzyme required for sulfatase activity/serine/threonine protein kinase
MDAPKAQHPADQTLRDYAVGKLDDPTAESVNTHLESCPPCRHRVGELTSDSFVGRLRDAQARPDSHAHLISSTAGLSMLGSGADSPPPPPASTLPPGLAERTDYAILRELGRGGMGVVYLAQNKLMGRPEVLKVVSSHLVNRSGVAERFLAEIRNAAKLHHTNVVTAYSALRLDESLVLAMQYVEGLDLARLVAACGPLPVAQACNYVHQAAKGLQHAHDHGMVHRDIEPSNLMLARDGDRAVIKVLDFGLAKVRSESPTDGTLTHDGQMLGTPHFIAPEQISNARGADIRADIYSLGCTLYYLLTGGPPFQGASLYDLLQAHHSMDAKPLNLARPEVPVELAALVAKMMAKEPERRFQEPKEVAQALTPFFKKGSVAFKSPTVELSQAGQTGSGRPVPGPVPKPTIEESNDDAGPITWTKKAAEPSAPATEWNSLINLGDMERSGHEAPAIAPTRRPPWRRPSVAIGALFVGLLLTLGVVILIKTANGTIELVGLPNDAEVFVDGEKVSVTRTGGEKPALITVTPGTRKIRVKTDQFETSGDEVTVRAWSKETFTVRLIPLPESIPTKVVSDDRTARSDLPKADSAPTDPRLATKPNSPLIIAGNPDSNPRTAEGVKKSSEPKNEIPTSVGGQEFLTSRIGQIKLKRIPAGTFRMGSPDREGGADEHPQHEVRISRPFYLGVYEVTQAQYEAIMGQNPSYFASTGDGKGKVAGQSTDQHPVESISWFDAVKFCNALSEKEGLKPFYTINGQSVQVPDWNAPGYRLPTDAEWESACRAGTTTRFSFGDGQNALGQYAWYTANSSGKTHPVGEKKPNAFGLHDMHGNVWELCWDGSDAGHYAQSPAEDPRGPDEAAARVDRGGSWAHDPLSARSAYRRRGRPEYRGSGLGFRLARNSGDEIQDHSQVLAANSNTSPTPSAENKGEKADSAGRVADEPAHIQAIDAAQALRGNAEFLSGRWLLEGRELVQTGGAPEGPGGRVLFGDLHRTDYDFTVDLLLAVNPLREKGHDCVGLSFRRTLRAGNYLDFGICGGDRDAGGCGITAFEDGQERELRHVDFKFVKQKWYTARVSVRRNHIVCTLHDDLKNEVVHLEDDDGRHPSGQVGLGTENSAYRFKNIKVTAPDGKVLWEMPPAIGEPPMPPAQKEGESAATVRGRSEPERPRATDAMEALRGKAEILSGHWLVEGKELVQTDKGGTILLGDRELASYDLKFQGQIVTGNEGFVALFHRTDDNNLRFFHVGEDGGKTVHLSFLFRGNEGGRSKPALAAQGRWYKVWVKVRGAECWCYVDGRELLHDVDKRFTSGRIGLATWDATARFRDVVVTTPEGDVLWKGLPDVPGE